MAHQSELIAEDIHAYLKQQEEKSLLRFITCGSVDDGKSTLIGRLLWDSKLVFEDQLAALESDSRRSGTQGAEIDYALLLDGLQAEREQGITIDVAYRFFSTDKRKFIVADTPGHEQYTRNMVTGASSAELAVILVDARKGLLTQTRRHSYLVSLVGIRKVVLAINKMDLIDYDRTAFERICADYRAFAADLGFDEIRCIPLSALKGDNLTLRGDNTPWYDGPTLLQHLETVQLSDDAATRPFRMRVQWVNRPDLDFRGFCGTIAGGRVRPGDRVRIASSGKESRVKRIVTLAGDLPQAVAGQAVTLCLEDEIDISRGEMLCAPEYAPALSDRLAARIVWLHDSHLLQGRSYLLKMGAATTTVQIAELVHRTNVNSLQKEPAKTLELNEIGLCRLNLSAPLACDIYDNSRATGSFILIDRLSNATVGAGMVEEILPPSDSIPWQELEVDREALATIKGQQPAILWITGRRCAGKTTLANLVQKRLHAQGRHTLVLDGDNIRRGLNADLDYTDSGQVEHIRRIGEVARISAEAGLIVLVATTSPYAVERQRAREISADNDFIEIFLDSPRELCAARDSSGFYRRIEETQAKTAGLVELPYEAPQNPELLLDASRPAETLAEQVIALLKSRRPDPDWTI